MCGSVVQYTHTYILTYIHCCCTHTYILTCIHCCCTHTYMLTYIHACCEHIHTFLFSADTYILTYTHCVAHIHTFLFALIHTWSYTYTVVAHIHTLLVHNIQYNTREPHPITNCRYVSYNSLISLPPTLFANLSSLRIM